MRRLTVMLLVNDLRKRGGERQALDLARGLDKERFRVVLAMLSCEGMWEEGLDAVQGVELRSVESRGRWDPVTIPRLVSLLRREQVDVIQPYASPATAFALAAALIARTPLRIVTERLGASQGSGLARFAERRLTRFAQRVVTDSDAGARKLAARGVAREKVRVINDGVAPDRLRTDLRERRKLRWDLGVLDESWVIGVAGSLTPETDHGNFLQAASIVRAEVPGAKFLIVGEGPLRSELTRRAMVLGIGGSVIFTDHPMRLAPYIGAMDIAVLPSAVPEGSSEFGLEAMGLGRPIVATDVGANSELFAFGEAGLVVPPGNPIILAHAILEMMRHPDAVERMRARGREIFRERFTLEKMVAAFEDLYVGLWRRYEGKHAGDERLTETVGES